MKFNVFGRLVQVERHKGIWRAYYLGNEGKKRRADDIVIPGNLRQDELSDYIADLCHEWATPNNSQVTVIE